MLSMCIGVISPIFFPSLLYETVFACDCFLRWFIFLTWTPTFFFCFPRFMYFLNSSLFFFLQQQVFSSYPITPIHQLIHLTFTPQNQLFLYLSFHPSIRIYVPKNHPTLWILLFCLLSSLSSVHHPLRRSPRWNTPRSYLCSHQDFLATLFTKDGQKKHRRPLITIWIRTVIICHKYVFTYPIP